MIATGGIIAAGSGVTLLARIQGNDGRPITRASLSGIDWTLTNLTTGAIVDQGSFVVTGSTFDSPVQDDPRWRLDSALHPGPDGLWGYNFLGEMGADNFPISSPAPGLVPGQGGPRYQVDVEFIPVSGQPFRQVFTWISARVFG